jgi:hypothetical protein
MISPEQVFLSGIFQPVWYYTITTFSDLQSGQIENRLPVLLYTLPQSSHRYLYHLISSISIFIGPAPEHMLFHPSCMGIIALII